MQWLEDPGDESVIVGTLEICKTSFGDSVCCINDGGEGVQAAALVEGEEDAKKKQRFMPVLFNEMMLFQLIQIGLLLLIFINFGFIITAYFILAALIGAILLETVNYIEHYGLQREKGAGALFERVQPHHSWNSNHIIGRLMLFELSRHSDHH